LRVCGFGFFHTALQVVQQKLCRRCARICHQQCGFQVFVKRVVDLCTSENGRDAAACFAQAGFQFV
jgi:hypothetical protein